MVSRSVINKFTTTFLYVLLAIIFVFGTYELVENLWLEDAYPGLIYYFHLVRGIGTSLLVVLIIWWVFLREEFLELGREALSFSYQRKETQDQPISNKLFVHWLIRLRWIAVVLCSISIYFFGVLSSVIPKTKGVFVLIGLVGLLTVFNIGYYFWALRQKSYRNQLAVQIGLDLLFLTLILHYSGGIENPFFLLYLFHGILASIVFRTRRALTFTTLGTGLFTGIVLGEYFGWVPHHTLRFSPQIVTNSIQLHVSQSPIFVFGRLISFLIVLYGTSLFTSLLMVTIRESRNRLLHETERRKKLLHELFTAQEEERSRVARDLHDHIGQELSALQMKISRIIQKSDTEIQGLVELKTDVEDTIEEVRSLSSQIRPPSLEDCGLPCAIDNHIKEIEDQYEPEVSFEYFGLGHEENVSYNIDIAIYRVMQEALLNALTHGDADQISILLRHQGDKISVLIEDDGIGFDIDKLMREDKREYLGIQGMQERIANLDGEFVIETDPEHGTQVKAVVPITGNETPTKSAESLVRSS